VNVDELLNNLPCGLLSFADDGVVRLANGTLHAMLGYAAGEIEGQHVERLLTIAGRIFYQTHFFPLLRLHGRAEEIFLLLRCKDGREVGALVNGVRHERGGVVVNDCVLLEVRERRKYEDALLAARRTAEAALATLAARTREVEIANVRLEEQTIELEVQQQELQEQTTELEAQSEALQMLNDELQARSTELDRARATADEANRAKTEFLATMSHELRTPLNAIGGYVDLLTLGLRGPLTADQVHDLERIRRANQHLMGLVTDILNFARLEAGQVAFHLEDVDLASAVADLEPLVATQLATRGLTFDFDGCTGAPGERSHVGRADPEKLRQVLLNLLTNAIKFTEAGGRVAVTCESDVGAGVVRLRVSDTGRGIAAKERDRIFEPFVQVDRESTQASQRGVGLGLAISRDLTRGMGGDLTVESEEGRGSTFIVTLVAARLTE
jgi:PAS domain S-box-containing protein